METEKKEKIFSLFFWVSLPIFWVADTISTILVALQVPSQFQFLERNYLLSNAYKLWGFKAFILVCPVLFLLSILGMAIILNSIKLFFKIFYKDYEYAIYSRYLTLGAYWGIYCYIIWNNIKIFLDLAK